jgi:hypothetical protein
MPKWEPQGPRPDAPPWAGGDDEAEAVDAPPPVDAVDADESENERTDQRTDEPTDEQDMASDGEESVDPRTATNRAAIEAMGEMPFPRPPRRTGVFLDPDDLREHVGGLLRVMLGGYQVDAWGNFTFTHEGARIFVTVGPSPIGPQVGVFSVTNLDIDLTPPLANFLVTTNHKLGFGSFSYDVDNRAVWLRHTLLGTTLDGPELQAAVAAVASVAASVDDHIGDQFGGRTFDDAPEDMQDRARPPDPAQTPYSVHGYL